MRSCYCCCPHSKNKKGKRKRRKKKEKDKKEKEKRKVKKGKEKRKKKKKSHCILRLFPTTLGCGSALGSFKKKEPCKSPNSSEINFKSLTYAIAPLV